jgi:hypothetical protein
VGKVMKVQFAKSLIFISFISALWQKLVKQKESHVLLFICVINVRNILVSKSMDLICVSNRLVLRRISEQRRDEMVGSSSELHKEELHYS